MNLTGDEYFRQELQTDLIAMYPAPSEPSVFLSNRLKFLVFRLRLTHSVPEA
jgi:hypothetical protein